MTVATALTSLEELSDWDLIVAAREERDDAFRALVVRHMPGVLACARTRLGHAAAAEDIAQEAFVRLFRSLGSIKPESELRPWLWRVTVNLCADALRAKERRGVEVSIDMIPEGAELRTPPVADESLVLEERRRSVWRALDGLDDRQREVVVLRYIAGWTYDEISSALDCAPGTVASRLHRAIAALGRILDGHPTAATSGMARPTRQPETT